MATAAHARRKPVLAVDDMDMQSDNDLDFGDGDIELDLEPTPAAYRQDDDVSIKDAASIGGHGIQTATADQDDFMADHEDFIEDDFAHQADGGSATADQPSTSHIAAAQVQALAPPDEDLLDYDDDEDDETQNQETLPLDHEPSKGHHSLNETLSTHQDSTQATTRVRESGSGEIAEQYDQHTRSHDQADQGANVEDLDPPDQANGHLDHHSEAHNEENYHTDGEDGGFQLQETETFPDDDENEHSDHDVSHGDGDYVNDNTAEIEHRDHQLSDVQPVTVNYAGNELWLFKQHDPDDSGDWLLEDLSLAKSRMSDLFQACRSSLGDDVSNEHEIGFRFDHLHSLELYEDNTACVAVSLERLVSLYHVLQAQDGNNEPESFYISLLFRPRFVTLLSDVAKYAEQGSGYAGLEAAVVAGETHFSNVFSGASTEHEPTDWENDEEEEVGPTNGEVQQHDDQSGHKGQEQEDVHAAHEEEQDLEEDIEQNNKGASLATGFHHEQHERDVVDHDNANVSDVPTNQPQTVGQHDAHASDPSIEKAAELNARREQEEEDLIDYSSDDEVPGDVEEVKHVNVNEPSTTSSTVQGDEITTAGNDGDTAVYPDGDDQGNEHDEVDFRAEDENDTQFNDQLLEGIDDTAQSYQNYSQAFDQDDSFQGFQADGLANQDYAGFEYQTLDQQLQLDFLNGVGFDAGDHPATTTNDFVGTDDFLDLDNASDWVTDQEPTSNLLGDAVLVHDDATAQDDEEDDAVEQSAAVVSSTAHAESASSNESKDVSPQGQKRSVDEAGYAADDALDSIDAKRPRV